MKPIKVMEWCIDYLDSKPILDIFLGSGSTMVAAHQLKRKCYGMELDPTYCDVIIKRMIKIFWEFIFSIFFKKEIYKMIF